MLYFHTYVERMEFVIQFDILGTAVNLLSDHNTL